MSEFTNKPIDKIGRTSIAFRCIPPLLLTMLMLCALPAHAQYSFQKVSFPGAIFDQVFGINNSGKVVGLTLTDDGADIFGFVYDMKRDEYTPIPELRAVLGISHSGVMAGTVLDGAGVSVCVSRDRKGVVTPFFPPVASADPATSCISRGINATGKVSGYERGATGFIGFVHDPKKGTFEEFLPTAPNELTIAQGINAKGQVVGNVRYRDADRVYPGSPPGRYGFRRETDGSVKFFTINGDLSTAARGISESGLVTGFFADGGTFKGWVSKVPKDPGFEDIGVSADQVVYASPCDPDAVSPGSDYVLFTDVFADAIRNDGVVAGVCTDLYVLFDDFGNIEDIVDLTYGFVATPE